MMAMPAMGAAMPAAGAGGAAPAEEAAEEKTSFDVILSAFDSSSKIKVIKEVRAVTSLGLKEAKELVEKMISAGHGREDFETKVVNEGWSPITQDAVDRLMGDNARRANGGHSRQPYVDANLQARQDPGDRAFDKF